MFKKNNYSLKIPLKYHIENFRFFLKDKKTTNQTYINHPPFWSCMLSKMNELRLEKRHESHRKLN